MIEEDAIAGFAALANPTRLRVLRELVRAGSGGMFAGQIAEAVGASPSRASFHLAAMAEAGLLTSHRDARQIAYRVNFDGIAGLIGYLLQDCCANDPRILGCCGLSAEAAANEGG